MSRRRLPLVVYVSIGLIGVCLLIYLKNSQNTSSLSLETTYVKFISPDGKESQEFKLEIAANAKTRRLGLMYRKTMPQDHGMIFVFPDKQVRNFWMKNTYLSLDMLFLDENLKIQGILHSVPPLNTEKRGIGNIKSKYVIELNAGTAKTHGIKKSWLAKFPSPLPQAI